MWQISRTLLVLLGSVVLSAFHQAVREVPDWQNPSVRAAGPVGCAG